MESKPEPKLCSACGVKPRADQRDKSTNTQCSDCKYEGQKRWTMNKAEQEQAQAFQRGVNAMREYFAAAMEKYQRNQMFSGQDVAAIIRRVDGPRFADSAATSPAA